MTRNGVSVAYVPDHQEPIGRPTFVAPSVLELCADADVLIHDAQLWADELGSSRRGDIAPRVRARGRRAGGVRTLVLFHHDPGHTDEDLDEMSERIAEAASRRGVEAIVTATEGMKLSVDPPLTTRAPST
ncbi:MAG: hypothetical protein R2695_20910 [Acidimicrobiales bacterium]